MLTTKGMRFPIDVILVCIRWYAASPLSCRHLEEMMEERGVFVDHSSINRWAIWFLPLLEKVFRKHKRQVDRAMKASSVPEKVTMDKSGANKVAMDEINARGEMPIIVRQVKYLNNIVEQDHRLVKRIIKPMLNFKLFRAAKNVLAGIELSFADQFYVLSGQIRPV